MKRTILTAVLLAAVLTAAYSQEGRYSRAELLTGLDNVNKSIALNPQNAHNYYIRARSVYYAGLNKPHEALAQKALRKSTKEEYLDRAKRDHEAAARIRNARGY